MAWRLCSSHEVRKFSQEEFLCIGETYMELFDVLDGGPTNTGTYSVGIWAVVFMHRFQEFWARQPLQQNSLLISWERERSLHRDSSTKGGCITSVFGKWFLDWVGCQKMIYDMANSKCKFKAASSPKRKPKCHVKKSRCNGLKFQRLVRRCKWLFFDQSVKSETGKSYFGHIAVKLPFSKTLKSRCFAY